MDQGGWSSEVLGAGAFTSERFWSSALFKFQALPQTTLVVRLGGGLRLCPFWPTLTTLTRQACPHQSLEPFPPGSSTPYHIPSVLQVCRWPWDESLPVLQALPRLPQLCLLSQDRFRRMIHPRASKWCDPSRGHCGNSGVCPCFKVRDSRPWT